MKADVPARSRLVTTSWDDGHPADLRVAALLEKHGIRGTFYVPCTNSEGRPVMDPKQIRQVGRRFEIGGHTRDHVSLTALAPQQAREQIRANKDRLEDLLGQAVRGFAYVRGHHNSTVRNLVAASGYSYARTVKNLMSTPGSIRLMVPTSAQFFAHRKSVYVRNYLSGGPTLTRAAILSPILARPDLTARLAGAAEACLRSGGCFHLWGHSWELDEHNLWDELDRFLRQLAQLGAQQVTNAELLTATIDRYTADAGGAGYEYEALSRQPFATHRTMRERLAICEK